jgi:hypothetical protein
MHPKVAGAIQEIDAALYNGDTFDDPDDRAELVAYVEKWAQELGLVPPEEEKEEGTPAREPSEGWKALGAMGADFIRSQLRRPSASAPVRVREDGSWRDAAGVVHAVNATQIEPDVDLGRETACGSACGSASWDPDSPRDYPTTTDETVDCMTCIVRRARSCP